MHCETNLRSISKSNKRYRKYSLKVNDFKWINLDAIYFPLQPLCEMYPAEYRGNLEIVPGMLDLIRDGGPGSLGPDSFPHTDVLRRYIEKNRFDSNELKTTRYYKFHRMLRDHGVNKEVRTDEWIYYKALRLIRLYNNIKEYGYVYNYNNDLSYIAVLEKPILELKYNRRHPLGNIDGYELYDGGHRAACLYVLGYKMIKALILNSV